MDTGSENAQTVSGGRFCRHIRPFSGDLLDGTLRGGVIGWLIRYHVAHCRSCQKALASLSALRDHLRHLGSTTTNTPTLGDKRWHSLSAALDAAEQRHDRS